MRRLGPLPFPPLLPLLLSLPACELTEVTVAPGRRVVVVQAVISRSDIKPQFVVVEYSQTGEDRGGFEYSRIPPGSPRIPVGGALVTIGHSASGACAGRVDTLAERRPGDSVLEASGTYGGSICPPAPGDLLVLRVVTPAGEVVTGSTTVPGAAAREVTWGGQPQYPVALPVLPFDRERDTMGIGVTPVSGRALQIEVRNSARLDDLAFFLFTDTMGVRVPGNLVNPFEGDSGESVFRAGRDYTLAVALADSNYYDFLRSSSDPFTGRGFINHLNGGIGVFGSVETTFHSLHVVAPIDDPREGVYRLAGVIDSLNVDARLELYLDEVQRDQFSAFVKGWPTSPGRYVNLSSDGSFLLGGSGEIRLQFQVPSSDTLGPALYALRGVRSQGGVPFPMTVNAYLPALRATVVDTLTAQQISGPGLATASPPR